MTLFQAFGLSLLNQMITLPQMGIYGCRTIRLHRSTQRLRLFAGGRCLRDIRLILCWLTGTVLLVLLVVYAMKMAPDISLFRLFVYVFRTALLVGI